MHAWHAWLSRSSSTLSKSFGALARVLFCPAPRQLSQLRSTWTVTRIHGWIRHWYRNVPGVFSGTLSEVGGLFGKPTGNTSVAGKSTAHWAGCGSGTRFSKGGVIGGPTQLLTNLGTRVNEWTSPPTLVATIVVPTFTLT